MSRKRKYILSRVVLGLGFAFGLAGVIAIGIAATLKHDHPLTIAAVVGLVLALVLIFAGSHLDPRTKYEKAAGSGVNIAGTTTNLWGSDPAEREANKNGFRLPNRPPQD
jgi:peptidoglycan/LPS O-acetylase OafA/YrhL